MRTILDKYISEFGAGVDVDPADAEELFDRLISETDVGKLISALRAWAAKGISEGELVIFASIMRDRCIPVRSRHKMFVDIVGTGGSKAKRFNVSTAAAFVTAGAGVPVAKHGNRAATSRSGSADVLSELLIDPTAPPSSAEYCLNDLGMCFMFAPNHHRLSTALAAARKQVGSPTIFNSLGPLCNPSNAPFQLIGVYDRRLLEPTAAALARLGTTRAWVVHGSDGLDELTLSGPTSVMEVSNDSIRSFSVSPGDFGIDPSSAELPKCRSAKDSADLIMSILEGRAASRHAAEVVKLNAAAAILIAGAADSMTAAFERAAESLESGAALSKLRQLSAATRAQRSRSQSC